MNFRPATMADCPGLADMNHQLIRDEGHRNPLTIPQLEERMRGWLTADYRAYVGEEGNAIVVYSLFREQADEIYLRQLFVARHRRREGWGRRMMGFLRTEVWPRHKRLTVEVLVGNTAAVAFWRAMGYRDYSLTLEIPGFTGGSAAGFCDPAK